MTSYRQQKDFYDQDSNSSDSEVSNRKAGFADGDLSSRFIDNFANLKLDSISLVDCTMGSVVSEEEESMYGQVKVENDNDIEGDVKSIFEQYREYKEHRGQRFFGFLDSYNDLNSSRRRENSPIACSAQTSTTEEDIIEFDERDDGEGGEMNCRDAESRDASLLALSNGGTEYDADEEDALRSSRHAHYTMETVAKHNSTYDNWLVVDNSVYDVTNWLLKHPGGARILDHYAGSDCTDAWHAMHADMPRVIKEMESYVIGTLIDVEVPDVTKAFRQLRRQVKVQGLMEARPYFFVLMFLQCIVLDCISAYLLSIGPNSPVLWSIAVVTFACSQVQMGWLQHDFGHNSVARTTRMNRILHRLTIGCCKGVSAHWWNFRHSQHHVVPNRLGLDPDISFKPLFLMGLLEPRYTAIRQKVKGGIWWPYKYQVAIPFLIPVYFHLEVFYFVIKRRDYLDLMTMAMFYARICLTIAPSVGFAKLLLFYYLIRLVESLWFTAVTQSNHLSNPIDDYADTREWVQLQTRSTLNISAGVFNDWFTGHLNYQIEHHFFPLMPRCNYPKVAPLVISFCESNKLPYKVKPMLTAFRDCLRSLKFSGVIWHSVYYE